MMGESTSTAHVGELDLCYGTFGQPTDRPLLLVMGLATQMIFWDEAFCQQLARRGHFVVRFDNRDIGGSTRIAAAGRPSLLRAVAASLAGLPVAAPYTVDEMAGDAFGLLDQLGIDGCHVVGASMGGMIAQQMAIERPNRVASLVSIMSHPGNPQRARPTFEASLALLRQRPKNLDDYVEQQTMLWRTIGSPGFPFPEQMVRERAIRAWDRGLSRSGILRQLVAIIASGDRTPALRQLQVPTLVIHGDRDPLVPIEGGRDTAAAIPAAELEVIAGMGHDLPREVWPRLVAAITAHTARHDDRRTSTKAPLPP